MLPPRAGGFKRVQGVVAAARACRASKEPNVNAAPFLSACRHHPGTMDSLVSRLAG